LQCYDQAYADGSGCDGRPDALDADHHHRCYGCDEKVELDTCAGAEVPAQERHRQVRHRDEREWRDKVPESVQQRDGCEQRGDAKVDKPDVPKAFTEKQLHDAEARRDDDANRGRHAEQPLALHTGAVVVPIAGHLATDSLRLKVHGAPARPARACMPITPARRASPRRSGPDGSGSPASAVLDI
jgi:hypothetical protein